MNAGTLSSVMYPSPPTLDLADDASRSPELSGAKASALARARAAGLPVLPGAVLTVEGSTLFEKDRESVAPELKEIWKRFSQDGNRALVVRSSSTVEDQAGSSMAGMFTSVLGVETWERFLDAIRRVLDSSGGHAMAVLIQPQLNARCGGVMFGLDPVTGRRDRVVVAAVEGGPDALVSGRSTGIRSVLTPRGRLLESVGDGPRLGPGERRRLTALAASSAAAFGGPQDVEWAFDDAGELWLLQSRPITAAPSGDRVSGPIFGPGPIAETFPEPLTSLEADLWVEPVRAALNEVLPLIGAASRRKVAASPVIVNLSGRIAMDLELIGALPRKGFIKRLDPRPSLRRLKASWTVGRLRAALPALAQDVVAGVDKELRDFPRPSTMTDGRLLEVLEASRQVLISLHGHELMAGLLETKHNDGSTGAGIALREVVAGRRLGLSDEAIVERYPGTLALVPPKIAGRLELPPLPAELPALRGPVDGLLGAREELRLRARLVQELTARVAGELGRRLAVAGVFATADMVRWVRLDELRSLLDGSVVPLAIEERIPTVTPAPLPAAFKLSGDRIVEVRPRRSGDHAGQGVSAGRVIGTVFDGNGEPPAGAILVVRTLDPSLASLLPNIAGLVAETGSVLSHLAILAREYGIPTVVDVPNAVERFAPGTKILVDGSTGDARIVEGQAA